MKPEHRHELKTNELAEWISNLPQWARENSTMLIYICVAVCIIAGLYLYRGRQKVASVKNQLYLTNLIAGLSQSKMQIVAAQAQGIDYSFILIRPADNLKTFAENTKDDRMGALALIKRADALRAELHYRPGTASEQETAAQLDKAQASYAEAFSKAEASGSAPLMAAAKFGLGLCEEERGNFEQARQIYTDISKNASFEGTTAAIAARQRLGTMVDYQQKIVFRKFPKPIPAEPAQQPIELVSETAADNNVQGEISEAEFKPTAENDTDMNTWFEMLEGAWKKE